MVSLENENLVAGNPHTLLRLIYIFLKNRLAKKPEHCILVQCFMREVHNTELTQARNILFKVSLSSALFH